MKEDILKIRGAKEHNLKDGILKFLFAKFSLKLSSVPKLPWALISQLVANLWLKFI